MTEVPQATAREEAIAVISKMLPTNLNYDWAAEILDELLAATQEDGAPLVILGPEQAGALVHEHYTDARTPFFVFHALPGPAVEPLFRAPFIEAQREEA